MKVGIDSYCLPPVLWRGVSGSKTASEEHDNVRFS